MVTLELILFLPVLVLLLLAVVEFAILYQVNQQVCYASKFGAKLASEVSRDDSENPHLGNFNDPGAAPPPPAGQSLKERIDQYLANHGLSESCQVILEHNVANVGNPVQVNPDPAPADCHCSLPLRPLPTSGEYVRVTVCLKLAGNVPNLLSTYCIDLGDRTLQCSTVLRYEPPEP